MFRVSVDNCLTNLGIRRYLYICLAGRIWDFQYIYLPKVQLWLDFFAELAETQFLLASPSTYTNLLKKLQIANSHVLLLQLLILRHCHCIFMIKPSRKIQVCYKQVFSPFNFCCISTRLQISKYLKWTFWQYVYLLFFPHSNMYYTEIATLKKLSFRHILRIFT